MAPPPFHTKRTVHDLTQIKFAGWGGPIFGQGRAIGLSSSPMVRSTAAGLGLAWWCSRMARRRVGLATGLGLATRLGLGLGCCCRNRLRSGLLRLVLALEWMGLGQRLLSAARPRARETPRRSARRATGRWQSRSRGLSCVSAGKPIARDRFQRRYGRRSTPFKHCGSGKPTSRSNWPRF
jgi:hypothetical protein